MKTYKYNIGEYDLADIGDKVIYVRNYVEGDNTDRYSHRGVRLYQWYEVTDVVKVEVGNVRFTNPYRYRVKVNYIEEMTGRPNSYDYTYLSAYQFMSIREWREHQINKVESEERA